MPHVQPKPKTIIQLMSIGKYIIRLKLRIHQSLYEDGEWTLHSFTGQTWQSVEPWSILIRIPQKIIRKMQ